MPDRTCLDCESPLTGRIDKKFCSDQCRNNYNNQLHRDANNYVRNVNNVLRRNRRILTELNSSGKTKVHRDKVVAKGFDFNFHTNTYTTKSGKVYQFCYEQGYLHLDDHYLMLVVREEYV